MTNEPKRNPKTNEQRWRLMNQLGLSIYFPLLAIWTNAQQAKHPWVIAFQSLIQPTYQPHSFLDTELQVSMHLLWALAALATFACLSVLALVWSTSYFERTVSASIFLAGFPAAFLYVNQGSGRVFDLLETTLALTCGLMFVFGRWKIPAVASAALLILHFGLWALYAGRSGGPGLLLLWFGFSPSSLTRGHPNLIYPLLGFGASLIWIRYSKLAPRALSSTGQ